jgi:hypothetical protein
MQCQPENKVILTFPHGGKLHAQLFCGRDEIFIENLPNRESAFISLHCA